MIPFRLLPIALFLALVAGRASTEEHGLAAVYYDNIDFSGTELRRIDPTIDFDWGSGKPAAEIAADQFSVCWTGEIQTGTSEIYTFSTLSDDGVLLWVDGQPIIDAWNDHGTAESIGSVALVAGRRYRITLRYYENGGGAVIRLRWRTPTIPLQVVPTAALFPPAALPATEAAVTTPLASRVDPAWFEGVVGGASTTVSVEVDGNPVSVTRSGARGWSASNVASGPRGIALDPDLPRLITITARAGDQLATQSQALTWAPTNLTDLPYGESFLPLRQGDRLLLTAGGRGARMEIDTDFDGTRFDADLTGEPGVRFAVPFTVPGEHVVCARIDGVQVGTLKVCVAAVDLRGPIACQLSFQRIKDVQAAMLSVGSSPLVVFTANDIDSLVVGAPTVIAGGARLTLRPIQRGDLRLQARLGSANGPLIAEQSVDAFTLRSSAANSIGVVETYPDGSLVCEAALIMEPLVKGLGIRLSAIVAGVTFADSTTVVNVSSDAFSAFGENGMFVYRVVRGPSVTGHLCHIARAYQGGVKISY